MLVTGIFVTGTGPGRAFERVDRRVLWSLGREMTRILRNIFPRAAISAFVYKGLVQFWESSVFMTAIGSGYAGLGPFISLSRFKWLSASVCFTHE